MKEGWVKMDGMRILFLVVGIVGIIACIIIALYTFKSYKQLQNNLPIIYKNIFLYLDNVILCKSNSFFRMVNSGEDLCQATDEIPYVDYFNGSSLFLEVSNGSNNI